jgi:GNAT superfamily N-acetyltransferase
MTSYSVFIVDASSRQPVEAELLDTIGERQLLDWQFQWRRILETYLRRLADNGVTRQGLDWPQSWHWDWRAKVDEVRGLLGHTGYSVICRDVTQGMMRLDLASRLARLDGQVGKPLVYIDYLEIAPWNWHEPYADPPLYRGIGQVLIRTAIQRSFDEGFHGRVGLHSLPQAVTFYERCGFTNLGTNPNEYRGLLPYFEITTEKARTFI